MEDVRDIQLAPWKRTGGSGAFVHLHGMKVKKPGMRSDMPQVAVA
jgi:hypothetical protein